jgi:hypothetical protein
MAGRTLGAAAVALALQAAVATVARGDGLPVLGFVGASHGVRAADGSRRYVARPRRRATIVKVLSRSGRTLERTVIPGRFDVPVVAYDGSTSGLSANDRTLVLIRPRVAFPQRATELVIVAARTLRPLRFERLRGDFSFDAISPSGTWVYLIQYTSRIDPTRYRVRALSTRTGQLLARDIVDPNDRGEAMRGNPMSRLTSPDGRWAYTLYDGDGHPFVHALDTVRLRARCIDIAAFPAGGNLLATRLRLTGRTLTVVQGGQMLTEIDTSSLSVIAPPRPTRAVGAKRATRPRRGDARPRSGAPAAVLPIAAAVALLAGAALALRRRFARLRRRVHVQ